MRFFLTPAFRLSLGLALLTASIIVVGDVVGVIPNPANVLLDARKKLCESLAVQFSSAISRGDTEAIQRTMQTLVRRNEDVLSAAMRTADGTILAKAGAHEEVWTNDDTERSTSTHAQVPIFKGPNRWGAVEVQFSALFPEGLQGLLSRPIIRTMGFVGLVGFFCYFQFIRKTLRQLDPSSVVPGRVRYALDTLVEGVVLMDERGLIVLANSAIAEQLGQSPNSLIGQSLATLPWVHATPGATKYPWDEAFESGRTMRGAQLSLRHKDGPTRRYVVNSSPIPDESGRSRGTLTTFDDITDLEETNSQLSNMVLLLKKSRDEVRRKNEELEATNRIIEEKVARRTRELRESMEEAQAAARAKSRFLANMSHELRTPMHAVLSFAEFGVKKIEKASKDRLLGYFREIRSSGENLMQLLNNLLDLSKAQAGKMTYTMRAGNLQTVLQSVLSELDPLIRKKNLRTAVLPAAFSTEADFDSFRIAQVARNLLSNAVKFTDPERTITMSFSEGSIDVDDEVRPSIELSVSDEGFGIPEEEIETIFDPFAQSQKTDSGAGGTGLGLSICKEIVDAHHGWIRAANRPGGGAIFTFSIPRMQPRAAAKVTPTNETVAASVEAQESTSTVETD